MSDTSLVPTTKPAPSARQQELLERAYEYSLTHGLADLSLRPLATVDDEGYFVAKSDYKDTVGPDFWERP